MEHCRISPLGARSVSFAAESVADEVRAALAPVARLDRFARGIAIEAMIAMLDAEDGDPDMELNGDEEDGAGAEDEICAWFAEGRGPGCETSDPGGVDQLYKMRPAYGIDQDEGPINEHEANVAYKRELYRLDYRSRDTAGWAIAGAHLK